MSLCHLATGEFISVEKVAKRPTLHWSLTPYRWIGFAWDWILSSGRLIFWKVFLTQLDARNISRGSLISWTLRCRLAEDLVGIPGLILEVLMWTLCWLFALDLENWIGLKSMTCYSSSGLLKGLWRSLLTVPQFPLCRRYSFGSCFMLSRLKKTICVKIYFLNQCVSKISHSPILKLNEHLLLSLHEQLSPYLTSLLLF